MCWKGPPLYAEAMTLFLRLLLGGLLVFSLAACAPGGGDDGDDREGTSVSQQDDRDDADDRDEDSNDDNDD